MGVKVLGVFKAAIDTRDVPAGTVIFEAGSTGEEMFGVVEGRVELRLPDGRSVAVGPDETFGEMALVDKSPRSATATATADSKLAVIDKSRFLFLVHETPTFALQVMSSLAERLRAMQQGTAEGRRPTYGNQSRPTGSGGAPCTTGFDSSPIPSIAMRTVSPSARNRGGSNPAPTPAGVPVAMRVPGSSGNAVVRYSIISAQSKIMSAVDES